MTAYGLSTSYLNDFELADWIEDATWERQDGTKVTGLKVRFGKFDTSDLQSLGQGIAFDNETAKVDLWQPNAVDGNPPNVPFAPEEGGFIRRDSKGGEGWMIKGFAEWRIGYWQIACEKEVTNG